MATAVRELTVQVNVEGGQSSTHKLRQVGEATGETKQMLERLDAAGQEAGRGVRRAASGAGDALDDLASEAGEAGVSLERAGERGAQGLRQAGQASARAGRQMGGMSGTASGANDLLFEMAGATQDAQYGFQGVSNQIPLMVEQFSRLQSKTGSAKGAMSALLGGLTGPGGLILGFTALTALAPTVMSFFEDTGDSADEAKRKYEDALDAVLKFELKSRTFTVSSAKEAEEAQVVVENMIERQKENLGLMADQLAVAGKTNEEIQSDAAYQEQVRRLEDYEGILKKVVEQREQFASQERISDALDDAGIDADTAAMEENTEAVEENGNAREQARSALEKARGELDKFEGKLDELQSGNLDLQVAEEQRLQRLRDQTAEAKAQLDAREQMIETLATLRRLDALDERSGAPPFLPDREQIEEQLQESTPDHVDVPVRLVVSEDESFEEQWDRKLARLTSRMTDFGSASIGTLNEVAATTEFVAGHIAGNLMEAFQAAGGAAKEFWAVYQAVAIAQAIADTYKAANAAYAAMAGIPVVGPALGVAAAAAAVAAGLANVSRIASSSPPGSSDTGGGESQSRRARKEPVKGYASGTESAEAGWVLVGEEGPELMQAGGGETVLTNENTGALLGAASMGAQAMAQARRPASSAQTQALLGELRGVREAIEAQPAPPGEGDLIAETRLQRGDLLVSVRRALKDERVIFGDDVSL